MLYLCIINHISLLTSLLIVSSFYFWISFSDHSVWQASVIAKLNQTTIKPMAIVTCCWINRKTVMCHNILWLQLPADRQNCYYVLNKTWLIWKDVFSALLSEVWRAFCIPRSFIFKLYPETKIIIWQKVFYSTNRLTITLPWGVKHFISISRLYMSMFGNIVWCFTKWNRIFSRENAGGNLILFLGTD